MSTIGVVIPCRDAARWLMACLESIEAQTRPPDEVVIVDDGSRDGTAATAQQWIDRGHPFQAILLRQKADGVHAAVTRGFAACTTDLLVRVDADDLVAPAFLMRLEAALQESPGAAYAYPAMRMFGDAQGRYHTRPFSAVHLVMEGNFVCSAALMRRDAYLQTGGLAALPAWEDWDLWLSFLDHGHEGVLVDEELYLWRRHGQTRNQLSLLQRRALRLRIMWRHRRLVIRHLFRGVPVLFRRMRDPVRQQ